MIDRSVQQNIRALHFTNASSPQSLDQYLNDNGNAWIVEAESDLSVPAVERFQPDLVLLDAEWGVAEILDLVRAIRDKGYAHLPLIVMVDQADPAILEALTAHVTDFVMRNENPLLIANRLKAHAQQHHQSHHDQIVIKQLKTQQTEYERIVRMIVHDMKHPVTNIAMISDLLRQIADPDAVAEILDSLDAASNAISEMLADFSDVSGVYLDTPEIKLETIDVQQLISHVVLSNLASAYRKKMTLQVLPSSVSIIADRDKLQRILNNLVSNAIKYSPHDTAIIIQTEVDGDNARISVTDEGPGIDPAEQHLLFTEFGRLSSRPTGEETSTGLGLWIVKLFSEAMNGQVGYTPRADRGATFWIRLPLSQMDEAYLPDASPGYSEQETYHLKQFNR